VLLSPISGRGARAERSLAQYIRRLRKQRARLERVRVLYVAATRARRQLHWFGAAPTGRDGALCPRADTLLGLLWPTIGAEFRSTIASAEPASLAPSLPASAHWRLPADWRPGELLEPVGATRLELSMREAATQPEYLWVGLAARAVGTIVHAELQRLSRLPQLPPAPDTAAPAYRGWLAELGVLPEERALAAERIYTALEKTLRDPRGRWLVGPGHREAHSEWRLTGLHAGRIVNVIVDRLLIDSQGERWLVDYKTSSHEGSDLEGFLGREVERYGPQLQRYAELVAGVAAGAVRAALYFPLLGEFRELELPGSPGPPGLERTRE
jgi:ATP-dependent exoDNAse (exonuclease V) beta subunit